MGSKSLLPWNYRPEDSNEQALNPILSGQEDAKRGKPSGKKAKKEWVLQFDCVIQPKNTLPFAWANLGASSCQKYNTHKQAKQALDTYLKGGGTWGSVHSRRYWTVSVIAPNGDVVEKVDATLAEKP